MANVLRIYLKKISKYPILSREQETCHFKKLKQNNIKSYNIIANSNLRLVVSIAKKYKNFLDIIDCIDLGNLGLITAINEFDLAKEHKFSTYATWWIHKTILEFIYRHNEPIKQSNEFYKIKQALKNFNHEHQKYPTIEQLSDITKIKSKTIIASLNVIETIYLDSNINENSSTYHEIIAFNNHEADFDYHSILSKTNLTEKEKLVITSYFGLNEHERQETLKEIGEDLGISSERIRQVKEKALDKLKKMLLKEILR